MDEKLLEEIRDLRRHMRQLEDELAAYAKLYGFTDAAKNLFRNSPLAGEKKRSHPHDMN